MKRDLTTDLKSIQEGRTLFDDPDPNVGTKYELYDIAEHAIERALKAERALGNETILNGKALAKLNERADKAEALARELVEDLERARGNLLLVLAGAEPDPKRYEIFLRKCTRTLTKAKEVLGDE